MNPFFCPKYFYALPLLVFLGSCGKTLPPEPDFNDDTAVNKTVPDEISPYMPQTYAGDPIVLTPPVKHKTVAHKHRKTSSVLRNKIIYKIKNNNEKTNYVISTPFSPSDNAKTEQATAQNVGQHSSVVFKSGSSASGTEAMVEQVVENKTIPHTLNFSGDDIHKALR